MKTAGIIVAIAASVFVATVGIARGTYAAGGSDSSCYALMAEALASGRLQPSSALASDVPWPDPLKTFTPSGFVPSHTNSAGFAPVCAPGFSLLLAPAAKIGGVNALFYVTPIAGALLVWLTFLAARGIAGPLAGAMAAVLVATNPAVLYQVVQPMNDVTTAALWMAVFVALASRRFVVAGICCGLALLVRPNLLPLAAVAALFVLVTDWKKLPVLAFLALPFGLVVLWFNARLYGAPFQTGYGGPARLFGPSYFLPNAARYLGWMVDTQTPFPLLAFAAPFVVDRGRRLTVWLALGLIAATCSIYFFYTPFDDWAYLRFLLVALSLMQVLASAVAVALAEKIAEKVPGAFFGRIAAPAVIGVITAALAIFGVRTASDRFAFSMQALEQRYRSAGIVVRDELPADAVVLSVWDSGAVRFHGRKEALVWEGLDPDWLDRSLQWLAQHGRKPYILMESWEEPRFRARFGGHSDVGNLDWPPKYEVDRKIRIYDPADRASYFRGERVATEYLWPLRR